MWLNTALQAQSGWNYEAGVRLHSDDFRVTLDASVFNYRINNSIVRRLHPTIPNIILTPGVLIKPVLNLPLAIG